MPEQIQASNSNEQISTASQRVPQHSKNKLSQSPYKTREGKLGPIQAKQRPVNKSNPAPRTIDPFGVKPNLALEEYQSKMTGDYGVGKTDHTPVQRKPNNTGLPDNLKTGVENLSGYAMDDVKVHYNSDKPVQLNAHAYAQGTDIHLAAGQERHLPHEAWHVVQQKQGRVKPTMQMKGGTQVNDDQGLEREADVMGEQVVSTNVGARESQLKEGGAVDNVVQGVFKLDGWGFEQDYKAEDNFTGFTGGEWEAFFTGNQLNIENFRDKDSVEFGDFSAWLDSFAYAIENKNNDALTLYFQYQGFEEGKKYEAFEGMEQNIDKYEVLTSIYNAYAKFMEQGTEPEAEVELLPKPRLLDTIEGKFNENIDSNKPSPISASEVEAFQKGINKITDLKNNIKNGEGGYNYKAHKFTSSNMNESPSFDYSTFNSKCRGAIIGNIHVIANKAMTILEEAGQDYLYKSKEQIENINSTLKACLENIKELERKFDGFLTQWANIKAYHTGYIDEQNTTRRERIRTKSSDLYNEQQPKIKGLKKQLGDNKKFLNPPILKSGEMLSTIQNELQDVSEDFLGNIKLGSLDSKLAIKYGEKKDFKDGVSQMVSKFSKDFTSEDELKEYFLRRWSRERQINYNEEVSRENFNSIKYHNDLSEEDITAAKDGELKLKILADLALKSNTKNRNPAFLINRIGHVHLNGGSWGLGFCYENKDGVLIPHVVDIAYSREGNKYKWESGGIGYSPSVPSELTGISSGG